MCATWLVHMCHMTHSYVVPQILLLFALVWLRLIPTHVCDMTHSYVQYDLFYVRHDSSGCLALDLFAFRASVNTTFPHAWHDWFTCVTWLIHMCDKRVWSNQYPASSTHWQMSLKLFVVRVSFMTKESEAINVLHQWLIDKWVLNYVSSVCRSWQKSLKQSLCSASSYIDKWVWNYVSSVCHPWQKSLKQSFCKWVWNNHSVLLHDVKNESDFMVISAPRAFWTHRRHSNVKESWNKT